MEITRTVQDNLIVYSAIIDGETVSHLDITADHRVVANVETAAEHLGEGYARALWEAANGEAECFHAQEHHRTPDGDGFARAVGGDSADETTDYQAECCICTGEC